MDQAVTGPQDPQTVEEGAREAARHVRAMLDEEEAPADLLEQPL